MHLTDWIVELQGHKRRVAYIEWHPTAENVLFSAGFDHLVIIWDIEKGEAVNVIDCHTDVIYCMSLNRDGSLLATTCKDKKLRVIEPRSGIVKSEGVCHAGSKASKVIFLGTSGRLLTTGFSRHSDRQYSIWDQDDLSHPLVTDTIDSSSGIVFPYFDFDTNIVYLAGKGDGNIRYYEIVEEPPYVHFLSQFLSGNPQRGLGFMPKRGMNTGVCEIFRFYKLHTTRGLCEPISMIVPRKSDQFHEDLYPDTASMKPSLTAAEWISGRNAMPVLMSIKTGKDTSPTYAPKVNKTAQANKNDAIINKTLNNNKRKFDFLATETTPDYRPRSIIIEKEEKTNNNQKTQFQQLQQLFNNMGVHPDAIENDIPLIKDISNMEDNFNTVNELRKAYLRQSDELRQLKKQLELSRQEVKELKEEIKRIKGK
ncbi:WD40 domain-containing protein [Oryctes borbonicus]|uniref:Coronin n=1 Tax=Oryctes borbonicus TaxID=1629725 RepID=A0A0T6B5F8_9SCAR|nr:WD40 domain-containing protein [Oryctes borbonicus]